MASTPTQTLIAPRLARPLPLPGNRSVGLEEARPHSGSRLQRIRKVLYIALAGIFFTLGMIGVVLPGLPTTPFLLLTSFFLARSWPRMHQRLMDNKLCGPILRRIQRGTESARV